MFQGFREMFRGMEYVRSYDDVVRMLLEALGANVLLDIESLEDGFAPKITKFLGGVTEECGRNVGIRVGVEGVQANGSQNQVSLTSCGQ